MLLQEINYFFFCSVKKPRTEGFSEEEEQENSDEQITFPDAALSKIGRLLQAVYIACNRNFGKGRKEIIVISVKDY